MASSKLLRGGVSIASLLGMGMLSLSSASAQAPAAPAAPRGAVEATEADIVITGTKRSAGELAQDAPVAVTAFSADQLDALNFKDLKSLSYTMPNVSLEESGTAKGIQNFAVRGLGVNSSIPSVDPTVGIFIDGVYQGILAGGVADTFDLEGVEVLRGPQGVLFGRNVTGGAIVMRTRAPTDYLDVRGKASIETGNAYTFEGAVSGPIFQDKLSGKLAYYRSDDDGWFRDRHATASPTSATSQFGRADTDIFRAALRFTPTEDLEFILRGSMNQLDAEGPASQNHGQWSRDSHDFAINEPGFTRADASSITGEANWNIGFGDGQITAIGGWSDFESTTLTDVDATVNTGFHGSSYLAQDQVTAELRYNGTFGMLELTTGAYYFQQDLFYIENRLLDTDGLIGGATINRTGGGVGDFDTWGAFVAGDFHLTDTITLNAGVRYTEENKEASVSRIRGSFDNLDGAGTLVPGEGVIGGSIPNRTLAYSDSPFDLSWNDVSPRVGVQWEPDTDTQLYAFAAKGFRSGGVNFRNTIIGTNSYSGAPTAFDAEEQTSFEVGLKKDFFDRRGRLNLALYHNQIDGLQRETNIPETSGVQQVIVNAGDAKIMGAELEGRFSILDNLLVTGQVGYTDASYDTVTAELDGLQLDCATPIIPGQPASATVGPCDADQEIPRVAPWTYGVGVIHDLELGSFGLLSSRVSYNHRDKSFYNDANTGRLNKADVVDLNFTFKPAAWDNWQFSLYGKNLTDETSFGGDTVLPDAPVFGGDGPGPAQPTFSPLNKGRIYGAEISARF